MTPGLSRGDPGTRRGDTCQKEALVNDCWFPERIRCLGPLRLLLVVETREAFRLSIQKAMAGASEKAAAIACPDSRGAG